VKICAGIWIDHRKAVIVRIRDSVEEIRCYLSGMEKRVRHSGDEPEDQTERRYANHLKTYYARIMSYVRDADAILIFGPGEAKVEFETRMTAGALGSRIVGIETVDKLTNRQIAARVRKHFHIPEAEKPSPWKR
jgi:hypothetical protein